jgi:hypothetical protein
MVMPEDVTPAARLLAEQSEGGLWPDVPLAQRGDGQERMLHTARRPSLPARYRPLADAKPAGHIMRHMSSKRSNRPVPPCRFCGTLLIDTTGRHETDSGLWEVELRCPDCERRRASYYTRSELDQLDRELDRAASEIETELGRLEALHMEEWIALFRHALDLDLIGPDDF